MSKQSDWSVCVTHITNGWLNVLHARRLLVCAGAMFRDVSAVGLRARTVVLCGERRRRRTARGDQGGEAPARESRAPLAQALLIDARARAPTRVVLCVLCVRACVREGVCLRRRETRRQFFLRERKRHITFPLLPARRAALISIRCVSISICSV